MTKKAERASNIRRLTAAEKMALSPMGGIVDSSVPDAACRFIQKCKEIAQKHQFTVSFGNILGMYRERVPDVINAIPVARQLELLDEILSVVDELRTRLEHLPQLVATRADAVRWKTYGGLFFDFRQQLDAELLSAELTLNAARPGVEKYKGQTGDKSSYARDVLFRDTATLLPNTLTKTCRARLVGDLLVACGVPVPEADNDLLRLLAKVGKIPA